MTTNYYVVAVDDNGDVMAVRAELTARAGIDLTVRTCADVVADRSRGGIAFENQGTDPGDLWEAARDALASIMPDEEDSPYGAHGPREDVDAATAEINAMARRMADESC